MGDVFRFRRNLSMRDGTTKHQAVTILTECISTAEFGPISRLHLYVGVQPGSGHAGTEYRVYAPAGHAVRDPARAPSSALVETYISQGQAYSRMADSYWHAPELTVVPPPGNPYAFTVATTIDLDHYEVGQGIPANRFFVRAFVETGSNPALQQPARYGFSNPIWLLRSLTYTNGLPAVVNPVVTPPTRPAVALTHDKQENRFIEFIGVLQYARQLGQPFADLPGATSPYPLSASQRFGFFRARNAP